MYRPDPSSLAADAAAPVPAGTGDFARALVDRQIGLLNRLAELGLERAAEAGRGGGEEGAGSDNGLAFSRIARAVRMTIALQSRLMKDLAALEQGSAEAKGAREAAAAKAKEAALDQRRERAERIVRRAIEAEYQDDGAIEDLASAAWERLTDDDIYGDITEKPLGEVVALICKDLELSPDWTAFAREAWAVAEAASGAPGSPFVRAERGAGAGFEPPAAGPPWSEGDP